MMKSDFLDMVLAGIVCCEDSYLVAHANTKDRSCICTSTPEKYGLVEDIRSNPAVVNPFTHDGSRVCGISFKNIYFLSDLSMKDAVVQDLVLAFNVSRGYGEGQCLINERKNK